MKQKVATYSTITTGRSRMKSNWKRLLWVLFVCLYATLFFYNCLKPFGDWLVPYIFTMTLIVWLAYEYYNRNLFFQSGSIPDVLYFWLARALFALFFYSALVIGIATIIWWQKNQIGLYPFINILGLGILICSVYLRRTAIKTKTADRTAIKSFYLSVILLIVSLALGYGSIFLVAYVVVIGIPLAFWNYSVETNTLNSFMAYVQKQIPEGTKQIDNEKLWAKYLDKRIKKSGKK